MNEQTVYVEECKMGCTDPLFGSFANIGESTDAAARYCSATSIPPTDTVSVYTAPCTVELSPYSIKKSPGLCLDVIDLVALYLSLLAQVVLWHEDEGNQRSEEPVSIWTSNACTGLPTETIPVQSLAPFLGVSGAEPVFEIRSMEVTTS